MTAPNQSDPSGALNPGAFNAFQAMTEADAKTAMTSGAVSSIGTANSVHTTTVTDRIDGAYTQITTVATDAATAVTSAQAAADAAAASADATAAMYAQASYWESEFVVASAAVVLGANELLIGLCQNVPTGLTRKVTDMHVAFSTQPNGMTFDLLKWSADGTTSSLIQSFTLGSNVVRYNSQIDALDGGFEVVNKERLYVNVTSVTGSVAPIVMQVLVFGVLYDPTIQPP